MDQVDSHPPLSRKTPGDQGSSETELFGQISSSFSTLTLQNDVCTCKDECFGISSDANQKSCVCQGTLQTPPDTPRFSLDLPMFEQPSMPSIQEWLPLDICLYLLQFLDPVSLTRLGGTCRFFNQCVKDELTWKHKTIDRFQLDEALHTQRLGFESEENTWNTLYQRLDSLSTSWKGFAIDRATNNFLPYPCEIIIRKVRSLTLDQGAMVERLERLQDMRREREYDARRIANQYDGQNHKAELSQEEAPILRRRSSFWTSPLLDLLFATPDPVDVDVAQPINFLSDRIASPTRSIQGNIRWPTLRDSLTKMRGTVIEDFMCAPYQPRRTSLARSMLAKSPLPSWMIERPSSHVFHPCRFEVDSWTSGTLPISVSFEEYAVSRGGDIAIPNSYYGLIVGGSIMLGMFDPGHPQFLGCFVVVMEEALLKSRYKRLESGERRGYLTMANPESNSRRGYRCSFNLIDLTPRDETLSIIKAKMNIWIVENDERVKIGLNLHGILQPGDEEGNVVPLTPNQTPHDNNVLIEAILTLDEGVTGVVQDWATENLPVNKLVHLHRKGDVLLGYYGLPKVGAFYFQL